VTTAHGCRPPETLIIPTKGLLNIIRAAFRNAQRISTVLRISIKVSREKNQTVEDNFCDFFGRDPFAGSGRLPEKEYTSKTYFQNPEYFIASILL
jgi:hypothetical protein